MTRMKFRDLNQTQIEYIDLFIKYLGGLKTSNDYQSPTRISDFIEEVYDISENFIVNHDLSSLHSDFIRIISSLDTI